MSSNFLQSMAVLEGARAALKVGAVSHGERVGFICDLRVEPDVIYAFFTAAGERGAILFLCMVERGRGYGPPDEFVETIKTSTSFTFHGRWRILWSSKRCAKSAVFGASALIIYQALCGLQSLIIPQLKVIRSEEVLRYD